MDNPQTPANRGIKGRALTSTPQERWTPQPHNEATNLNEAHHEPSGNASHNPDESITNKHVQGRSIPPKEDNIAAQPQQSSSEEGSKENTILNVPRNDRERSAQGCPSRPTGNKPQGSAPTAPTTQAGGPSQAPPVTKPNTNHHRIHQNTMTPMDPPKHLQVAKAKDPPNQRRHRQIQVLLLSLPTHQRTLLYVLDVAKVAHWSRNCPYYNFCDFCRVTTHSTHMCRANKHGPRSPVCIYCGKTNHSSAYCRYRPKDNQEEP